MMFYDRHELHLYDIILIRLKTFITLEILFICTFCNAGGGGVGVSMKMQWCCTELSGSHFTIIHYYLCSKLLFAHPCTYLNKVLIYKGVSTSVDMKNLCIYKLYI